MSWKYHRGVELVIPPFGSLEVSAEIMQQLMPDQPGYENIRTDLDHYGLFLRDNTRTYESQAVDAIIASLKAKEQIYNEANTNIRSRAAQAGNVTEDAIQHKLEAGGYMRLKADIAELTKIKTLLEKKTQKERKKHEQYDPERTLLFTNPPMVFESATAMQMYLMYNKEHKTQYDEFMKSFKAESSANV